MEVPDWVPRDARLVIHGKNADSMWGDARIGARRLGQLSWSADGKLLHEQPFDAKGRAHGIEIERDDDGGIAWCAQWVHGSMHGPAMQLDERGRPILVTYFVRGRGTDIWASCGKVSELRELADGVPHGLVRWGDPRKPWEEEYYFRGRRHGVPRQWEPDGRLREGFPRYYVADSLVSRRAYEKAQAGDPTLRPYLAKEDRNQRALPEVAREALARARGLRRELALVEHARRVTLTRRTSIPAPRGARQVRTPRRR